MSLIFPLGGVVSAGTSSSPVLMMAITGRRCTSTDVTPSPASSPSSWGLSNLPASSTLLLALTSSPFSITFSRGETLLETSMVRLSIASVYSTITTASAPTGSSPPVQIFAACPDFISRPSGEVPMATSPMTSNSAGCDSEAPKVSAAFTAYPSIVDLLNGGRSSGDRISLQSTRPRACSSRSS